MNFETTNRAWWGQVTRSVRAFPIDLTMILGLLVLVNVVFRVPSLIDATIVEARVQTLIAIPTLLFIPGYVLVAILFPGDADRGGRHSDDRNRRLPKSIDLTERAALSFGMSVALVPLFALAIGTGWEFSTPVVLTGLTVVILIGIGLAAIHRLRLPPGDRFSVPVLRWWTDLRRGLLNNDSAVEGIVNLVLIVAVLTAVGAVGYAVATPYQSSGSSTLYLVTENETGTQIAADYPTEFVTGEAQPLTVGVRNDENRDQPFTVVVMLERVETDTGQTIVIESSEIDRFQRVVPAGETWTNQHAISPTLVGEDLRLHYYLYKGTTAPPQPDPTSAYRDVYIWIDVVES